MADTADDTGVIGITRREIERGRSGVHVILPQSAFLIGDKRLREDTPAVR